MCGELIQRMANELALHVRRHDARLLIERNDASGMDTGHVVGDDLVLRVQEVQPARIELDVTEDDDVQVRLAEKLAAWRTAKFFEERAARADPVAVDRLLARGGNEPPCPGDEIPEDVDLDAIRGRLAQAKRQA